jgi:hypothetical protein
MFLHFAAGTEVFPRVARTAVKNAADKLHKRPHAEDKKKNGKGNSDKFLHKTLLLSFNIAKIPQKDNSFHGKFTEGSKRFFVTAFPSGGKVSPNGDG